MRGGLQFMGDVGDETDPLAAAADGSDGQAVDKGDPPQDKNSQGDDQQGHGIAGGIYLLLEFLLGSEEDGRFPVGQGGADLLGHEGAAPGSSTWGSRFWVGSTLR